MNEREAVGIANVIQGWMNVKELAWIYRLASSLPPAATWIEVGSWKGRSMVAASLGLPKGSTLWSVENFAGNPESKVQGELRLPVPWVEWQHEIAMRLVRKMRPDVHIDLLKVPSSEGAWTMKDGGADVVFLDASFTYEPFLHDLNAWLQKVKRGGYICGHERYNKGIMQALGKVIPNYKTADGTLWWIRR